MRFSTKREAAGYLAAMIDGEGSVILPSPGATHPNSGASLVIANTDFALIEATQEACDQLNIRYRINCRKPRNAKHKDAWVLAINYWDDFVRLLEEVPIQSNDKRGRLKVLLSRRRDVRKVLHINRPEFCERYLAGWSTKDLGKAYGLHPTYVLQVVRQFGLKARTRSESIRLAVDQSKSSSV